VWDAVLWFMSDGKSEAPFR